MRLQDVIVAPGVGDNQGDTVLKFANGQTMAILEDVVPEDLSAADFQTLAGAYPV